MRRRDEGENPGWFIRVSATIARVSTLVFAGCIYEHTPIQDVPTTAAAPRTHHATSTSFHDGRQHQSSLRFEPKTLRTCALYRRLQMMGITKATQESAYPERTGILHACSFSPIRIHSRNPLPRMMESAACILRGGSSACFCLRSIRHHPRAGCRPYKRKRLSGCATPRFAIKTRHDPTSASRKPPPYDSLTPPDEPEPCLGPTRLRVLRRQRLSAGLLRPFGDGRDGDQTYAPCLTTYASATMWRPWRTKCRLAATRPRQDPNAPAP